jgi:branched-chain amino acid transport system ATP-binding protein
VSQIALNLKDVTSGYKASVVLRKLSLSVANGEAVALLGKNGMGKTTLLKTALGLLPLRSGAVLVDGGSTAALSPARLVALGIGYAPQEQPLFPDLAIRDNLRLALRSDRDLAAGLDHVAGSFPFLRDRLRQRAGTLSGGEQKMLILARALMMRPRLLLIDEISEGLQPSVVSRIAGILKAEREERGTAMLVVEQNLDFALRVADRWAVLKMGEIDDEGVCGPEARPRVLDHLSL